LIIGVKFRHLFNRAAADVFVAGAASASFDISGKRIWVAGHRGMVGSAVVRRLSSEPCEILVAGREELDLTRQAAVEHGWSSSA
jgi:FlaA1/EpsC-like NDP-sugar epimerase